MTEFGARSDPAATARGWARAFGVYVLAGGCLSFLGWAADVPRLTDWIREGISIQPNTTVAAAAAGAGLVALSFGSRAIALALGALCAVIGGTAILQIVTGWNLGIDTVFLFGRPWGGNGVISPGRVGPPGAASWTAIGVALVLAARRGGSHGAFVPPLALVTLLISSVSLIGYFYGAQRLYDIPTLTIIALQTSTFVLAASLGLLLSVPHRGPAQLLFDAGPGGQMLRRVLPALIFVPILLGFVRLVGQSAGLYDVVIGTAVRTVVEIVLLFSVVWWAAVSITRLSERRQAAETRLAEQDFLLRAAERRTLDALASDLADSRTLQRISAEIIQEDDVQSLYTKIVGAAAAIMHADAALLQMLDDNGALKILASQGFAVEAIAHWNDVPPTSPTFSQQAVRSRTRQVAADVTLSPQLAGTDDLQIYLGQGVRSVQATPLVSRAGRVLGAIATHWNRPRQPSERELRLIDILARQAADLIERREAEQALIRADRRKDEFLATLAHELRNPLAPIRSAVEIMKHAPDAGPGISYARDVIGRQVELMARLLDDLLDVSRIVGDRLELRVAPMDVADAIRAAVEQCRPIVDAFSHHLEIDLPDRPVYVRGDLVRLGQVFGNLLNNACRYTRTRGHIRISAFEEHGRAVITVQDDGIGIPPEQLARVFDLFSQVDPAISQSHGGLGIGLYLVRRLVQMHGGVVEASSDGPDRGSAFTVRLPAIAAPARAAREVDGAPAPAGTERAGIAAAPALPAALSVAPPPGATSALPEAPSAQVNGQRRVLVVDDNVDAASCLAVLLQQMGNDTHVVHDGLEAVTEADRLQPDVIVLDIGLPRLDGFEVCRQLRQRPWAQSATIIALTGWGQETDRRKSREAGFDHHLVKPVEQSRVAELLRTPTTRSN